MSAQDKIRNLEIAPPEDVWNNIAAKLDETSYDEILASKIKETASTPPPEIWNSIENKLADPPKHFFLQMIRKPWLRMVVAFILLFAVSIAYLVFNENNRSKRPQEAAAEQASSAPSRYYEVVNTHGEKICISDKIFQLECIQKSNASDTIEVLKRLQSGACFSNINTVQHELSYATMLNSPGGILEISQMIQPEK